MIQKLLRHIAIMGVLLVLGVANWITAKFVPEIWFLAISISAAIICFFMAWRVYRKARDVAKILDLRREILKLRLEILEQRILTLHLDILALERATFSTETEAEKKEEHEDIGHPV